MTRTVTCDVCFGTEDIDGYDVSESTKLKYSKCPPDWMVSINGHIEIATKYEVDRNVRITNICYDCLKEAVIDLLLKRREKEEK